MIENKKFIPKRRFKGFQNAQAWEQRKLGDVAIDIVAGGDIDKSKISNKGRYPVLANALTNDGIVGYYQDEYRIKAPAVTVTGRGDVGHAKARKIDFTPVVRLLSIISEHDVDFLENAINTLKIMVESTGVPQLTVPQLAQYKVSFPKTKTEEQAIGKLFTQMNDLITHHQRKLEKTKAIKSAYLSEMFPAEGEREPKRRFAGFTNAWEQRKLGDLCSDFKSGNNITDARIDEFGEYPVYGGNGLRGYTDTFTHDGNYVLIGRQGALCGNINTTLGKAYISEHAVVIGENEISNIKWLEQLLIKLELNRYSESSAQPGLSVDKLKKIEVLAPSKSEQTAVGDFFCTLDDAITLHQRKLEKLQNIKKAYLNEMFI